MKALVISVTVVLTQVFTIGMSFNCPDAGLFPTKGNCTLYYKCESSGDMGKEEMCPPHQVFYPPNSACVLGRCVNEGADDAGCTKPGFRNHPYSCQKFIRCIGDENDEFRELIFDCAPGAPIWCQEIDSCVVDETRCPSKCLSSYEK